MGWKSFRVQRDKKLDASPELSADFSVANDVWVFVVIFFVLFTMGSASPQNVAQCSYDINAEHCGQLSVIHNVYLPRAQLSNPL